MQLYRLLFFIAIFLGLAIPVPSCADEPGPSKSPSLPTEKVDATDDEAETKNGEDSEEEEEDSDEEEETHTVKAKRMKVEVELDGHFVAQEMTEIVLRPKSWSDYEIVEAVAHGTMVRKGDVLLKFDDRRIRESIDELELKQRLGEISLRRAEQELPRLEKTLAMDLEEAELADQQAKEDYKRFQEIEQAFFEKSIQFQVTNAENNLEYELEELTQLQKMYEADDLTEETEEIVLKRQRNAVEVAKFSVEDAQLWRDQVMDVLLPRMKTGFQNGLKRRKLSLERAKMAQSLGLSRAQYELEQKKQSRAKSLKRHAKLLGDRALMEIQAPTDGMVYFGECTRGKWSGTSSKLKELLPHKRASTKTVLMTIVQPRPLVVMAQVGESERPDMKPGQAVRIQPPTEDAPKIDAKIGTISAVPVGSEKFAIDFELEQNGLPDWVVAGLSCKIKITTYDQKKALVIPQEGTHVDDDDRPYVWVVDPDDSKEEHKRRHVTLGKRNDDDVEVLEGLQAGEVISLEEDE